ncbi:MAG: DNRLRE domain-containing protein [Methylobacter sp.]|nr:DNRLRE domain-containing protein [Methylobacter sp.]
MLSLFLRNTAVITFGATLSLPALATTITIGASRDATIYENNTNNSNGAGPVLFAGTNGGGSPRRGLLDFDIAGAVPTGATINAVQLTLSLGQVAGSGGGVGDPTPRNIELHTLTSNWGEGTTGQGQPIGGSGNGFPANTGDATWNARLFPGTLWTTPGGDFAASASASTLVDNVIDKSFTWQSTTALVNDVQSWLDTPATNFGWAVVNADESTIRDFRAFYTRDFANAALDPALQITYTVAAVPLPPAIALFASGLFGLRWLRRCKR